MGSQSPTERSINTTVFRCKLEKTNSSNGATSATLPDINKTLRVLAAPRLDSYRKFFGCQTDTETLGAYLWGQAITSALQPLLGLYEVILRNAIHREASLLCSGGTSESHPWYDYHLPGTLPTKGKSREKIDELLFEGPVNARLYRSPQLPPDQVVASLSFGFWPNFLEGLNLRQRPKLFTSIFVHHPHTSPRHWGLGTNAETLILQLKKIQELRNNVSHYEPVWKPHRLYGIETHWSHAVSSLRKRHDEILEVLSHCSPDAVLLHRSTYGWRVFNRLCTTHAVQHFKRDPFTAGELLPFLASAPALSGQQQSAG